MVLRTCKQVRTVLASFSPNYVEFRSWTGGGIVFDSVEEDEYVETINKLGANVRCIDAAEGMSTEPPIASYTCMLM